MKLEQQENEIIFSYISRYKEIYEKIKKLEAILDRVTTEKNNLINELEYNRSEEISFLDELMKKYGQTEVTKYLESLMEKQ